MATRDEPRATTGRIRSLLCQSGQRVTSRPIGAVASAATGTAEHGTFGGEIFHGPTAAHELWRSLVTRQHSRESACMFPDAEALLVPDSELSDTWRSALSDDDIRVRAIIGV